MNYIFVLLLLLFVSCDILEDEPQPNTPVQPVVTVTPKPVVDHIWGEWVLKDVVCPQDIRFYKFQTKFQKNIESLKDEIGRYRLIFNKNPRIIEHLKNGYVTSADSFDEILQDRIEGYVEGEKNKSVTVGILNLTETSLELPVYSYYFVHPFLSLGGLQHWHHFKTSFFRNEELIASHVRPDVIKIKYIFEKVR